MKKYIIKSECYMLEISNIQYFAEDAENGNPYNTSFRVEIISDNFRGVSEFTIDMKFFKKFIFNIKEIYESLCGETNFTDLEYCSTVNFEMQKSYIHIYGVLYGLHKEQSMNFNFSLDQTYLKDFVNGLYFDFVK